MPPPGRSSLAVDRPLAVKEAAGEVYRIARAPDPWAWADWAYAGPDGTFDNRWDDPEGIYRVLYASSQRAGAFVETLARYRVDLAMIAEMERSSRMTRLTLQFRRALSRGNGRRGACWAGLSSQGNSRTSPVQSR